MPLSLADTVNISQKNWSQANVFHCGFTCHARFAVPLSWRHLSEEQQPREGDRYKNSFLFA